MRALLLIHALVFGAIVYPVFKDKGSILMQVQSWSEVFEEQAVGEVSERSGRGKHTTRHVSLLKLPKAGYLADTPGFNQPGLAKVSTKSLPFLFPEVLLGLVYCCYFARYIAIPALKQCAVLTDKNQTQ